MGQSPLDHTIWIWLALGAYALFILYFAIRGGMNTKSMQDYASGTFQFSPLAVGLSLAAGMTSAATFIINPGFVAYYGISGFLSMGVFLPIGAMVSLVIFSKKFKKIGAGLQARTISQWMSTRYQHKNLGLYFAFLSLLLITFIVLICVGLTQIISKAVQVEPTYVLIGIIVFTFGYMMFGGANSMVYTNMIQAILMLIVAIFLLTSGYEHFANGVFGFIEQLKNIDPQLVKPINTSSPLFRDWFEVMFCQLVVGVAIVCQPHIITRVLLLRKDSDVNRYLTIGVIVQTLFFLVVFAGLYARILFPDLTQNAKSIALDAVMSSYVIEHFPVYVSILLVLGMISAGISTLEGLIQALSTTFTLDITPRLFPKFNINGKTGLILNRSIIFVLAIISFVLSYQQIIAPDLSVGIFAQNGVYAYFSAAFVPVLFGIYFKNAHGNTVFYASVIAVIVHFSIYYGRISDYMESGTRNPGIAAASAILISLFVGLTIHYLSTQYKTKLSSKLANES